MFSDLRREVVLKSMHLFDIKDGEMAEKLNLSVQEWMDNLETPMNLKNFLQICTLLPVEKMGEQEFTGTHLIENEAVFLKDPPLVLLLGHLIRYGYTEKIENFFGPGWRGRLARLESEGFIEVLPGEHVFFPLGRNIKIDINGELMKMIEGWVEEELVDSDLDIHQNSMKFAVQDAPDSARTNVSRQLEELVEMTMSHADLKAVAKRVFQDIGRLGVLNCLDDALKQ